MPGNKWPPQLQRFMRSVGPVDPITGCQEWTGNRTKNGYGFFQYDHTATTAHRWLFNHARGEKLPRQLDCCHKCNNRLCVNLDHLYAGTRKQNMADAVAAGRMDRLHKARGESHGMSKLTSADVLAIREAASQGVSRRELSEQYRMAWFSIDRIIKGLSWKHL